MEANACVNLGAWLLEGAQGCQETALICGESRLTYDALARRSLALAGWLQQQTAPNRFVPIIGNNSIEQVIAYLATLKAGAIPVPLSPLDAAGLRSTLRETGAQTLFVEPAFADLVRAETVRAGTRVQVMCLDATLPHVPFNAPPSTRPDETAILLYTSGSTGAARGVMLSARNIRTSTEAILAAIPLSQDDRSLVPLPFYYCYGLSVLHTHLRARASLVIDGSDYPGKILDRMVETGVTGVSGVPSFFNILLRRSSLSEGTMPRLRWLQVSGGRLSDQVLSALKEALPETRIYIRYGVTESTAAVSILPPECLDARTGSIGKGLPGLPLFVERPYGHATAPGSSEEAEIVLRGAHVALGYFQGSPDAIPGFTKGAFRTGDLAKVDQDGFVYIVGREREFIKTAGHRVAPEEVEEVISLLPAVEEVGVYGAPHSIRGEALVAVVVVHPRQDLPPSVILEHCARHLPPHKIPIVIRFASELPKTASGKVLRRALEQVGQPYPEDA